MTQHIHHDLIVQWAKNTTQVVEQRNEHGWFIDTTPWWYPYAQYRIRHKHQDLIDQKAARPELIVEYKDISGSWNQTTCSLAWNEHTEYRLVEPTKKKVKMWQWVVKQSSGMPHLTSGFYQSEHDVVAGFLTLEVIQRADWTEICMEEE